MSERQEIHELEVRKAHGETLAPHEEAKIAYSPFGTGQVCHACDDRGLVAPTVILDDNWSDVITREPSMN